ncbi:MAG: PhoH family protein [Phycisphaerales bacterium]
MQLTLRVPEAVDRVVAFGTGERHLKMIRETLGVAIGARAQEVTIEGERPAVIAARGVIEELFRASDKRRTLSRQEVLDIIADRAASTHPDTTTGDSSWADRLDVYAAGRRLEPKSANQRAYLNAIEDHDLVFGVGPAGTGKTYLAVAAAIHLLKVGRVKKAILARPAVEAGEKLGYLPGDMYQKVNPYLRPLLDALEDMMDYTTMKRFMAADVVEVVPLAFMRGRTLNDAVIILDEAQNTTRGQMQMFLTRMGQRSKMIVTGDPSQIDLPEPSESGLIDAMRRLRRVPGIASCALDKADVVRHPLVQRIIDAYEPAPSLTDGGRE